MRYTIRHFDLPLLTFEANMDSADTDLHIIKVYEENRSFLPLNLTVSEDGVERWLRHRTIPKNRAYVDALLSKVGLSLNRPLGIIAANKGLSLNDCFWVDAEGSGDTFEKVNLYDNRFSQVLAAIAFTGYGSSIRTSLASCPEFSTNGMLPKCWRRQNGKIYLYKGGTSGFSNLGFEPYSELYAYQVAQAMGVNAIRYTLTKDLKKTLCSKCELFTSKEYSYIPIGQLVSKGGIQVIENFFILPAFCGLTPKGHIEHLQHLLLYRRQGCKIGVVQFRQKPRQKTDPPAGIHDCKACKGFGHRFFQRLCKIGCRPCADAQPAEADLFAVNRTRVKMIV